MFNTTVKAISTMLKATLTLSALITFTAAFIQSFHGVNNTGLMLSSILSVCVVNLLHQLER
jgi:hypothetical protein